MSDEKTIKYIIIGDSGVGKTNIIYRFVNGEFVNDLQSTIGMEFTIKRYKIDGKTFHLHLYDTGGAEHFGSLRQNYYYNADCVLIVYDITKNESFKSIDNWIKECEYSHNEDLIKILVGNKSDLREKREVSQEEGKDLAEKYGIDFYESSALLGYNIEKIFIDSCKKVYSNSIEKNSDEDKILQVNSQYNGGQKEELNVLNNDEIKRNGKGRKSCCFH